MTVREIIIEKLSSIGADGLCSTDNYCGCGVDDDRWFMRCECDDVWKCKPAKRTTATEAGEFHEIGDAIYEEMK